MLMYRSRHSADHDAPAAAGAFSRLSLTRRAERRVWATLLALAVVFCGGAAYAAVATSYTHQCLMTVKANGGQIWDCDPIATGSPTPTVSATQTASPSPSATVPPSPTVAPTTSTAVPTTPPASPTPSPSTSSSPPAGPVFPTATSVGAPQPGTGWNPTARGTWTITAPGVYSDVRVNGSIFVRAQGVTLRRVEVIGGIIQNEANSRCYNGLVLEDVTVRNVNNSSGAVQPGGYTARRVALINVTEGFRVGGLGDAGCGPVLIENSYARAVPPPGCGDWHGDALQGYDAPPLTIRNSTLILDQTGCSGTSAYFYPLGQSAATVDGLLVSGGGWVFRSDSPVSVRGLRVVDGTWQYGPVDKGVTCPRVTSWVDNAVSDALGNVVRPIVC
jgi:hypothetical protein